MWLSERNPSLPGRPRPPCLDVKQEGDHKVGEKGAELEPTPFTQEGRPRAPHPGTPTAAATQVPPARGRPHRTPPTHTPASRPRLTGCRLCGNITLAVATALFPGNSILRSISNFNPAEDN